MALPTAIIFIDSTRIYQEKVSGSSRLQKRLSSCFVQLEHARIMYPYFLSSRSFYGSKFDIITCEHAGL